MLGVTGIQPSPAWQWTVAFCATFVVLLPATAAMGATLPAISSLSTGSHAVTADYYYTGAFSPAIHAG